MFKDWFSLLIEFSKNKHSTQDFICPECGQKSVECIYVGDPVTRIGYLPIWCKNCNKGIQISRVIIPKGVNIIEFGDYESLKKIIPNFKHIAPNE